MKEVVLLQTSQSESCSERPAEHSGFSSEIPCKLLQYIFVAHWNINRAWSKSGKATKITYTEAHVNEWAHIYGHTHTHTLFRPQDLYNSVAQCFWYLLTAWLTVEYWASDITSSPETIEETAELFYPTAVHWTQSIHTWKWSSYISRHRISVYCLCVQYTIWHYCFMFWTVINSVTPKEALCSNK